MSGARHPILAASAVLAAAGLVAYLWLNGSGERPPVRGDENAAAGIEKPLAAPPFRVAGTVIAASGRLAQLVPLDAARRPAGGPVQAREGETVLGYRIAHIDNHRVYFEKDGHHFRLDVGADESAAADAAPLPPTTEVTSKERPARFVPPPANIEEVRANTEAFVERLQQNPDFRRRLDEKRRELQGAESR
jgi:hypothetical protein